MYIIHVHVPVCACTIYQYDIVVLVVLLSCSTIDGGGRLSGWSEVAMVQIGLSLNLKGK